MQRKPFFALLAAVLAVIAIVPAASAIGSPSLPFGGQRNIEAATTLAPGFSYQGRLSDGGSPANGTYDIRFVLYDAEIGGAQVAGTDIILKEDVTVTGGLFTVELNFGQAAFNGDARWLELAVRPGAATTAPVVLSPRQPVNPAPYALYAKTAGGLVLPASGTASVAGVPASTAGLFQITQTGSGIAITGQRTTDSTDDFPAILGTNSGTGAGVHGQSTAATGGVGGRFVGATAIELDGAIKVSGANKSAFAVAVTASPACLGGKGMVIDSPVANARPNAMLFASQTFTGVTGGVKPVVFLYNPTADCAAGEGKWVLYAADAAPFVGGETYNVLVIQ